jgi:hypothetical protein
MMREAVEIAALRDNHHGQDRGDAGQGAEPLEIRSVLEQCMGAGFQGQPALGQPSELGEPQAKRLDRDRLHGDPQGDAPLRSS